MLALRVGGGELGTKWEGRRRGEGLEGGGGEKGEGNNQNKGMDEIDLLSLFCQCFRAPCGLFAVLRTYLHLWIMELVLF